MQQVTASDSHNACRKVESNNAMANQPSVPWLQRNSQTLCSSGSLKWEAALGAVYVGVHGSSGGPQLDGRSLEAQGEATSGMGQVVS